MKLDDKSAATHVSINGVSGMVSRFYFLHHDGALFRWSVKYGHWTGTQRTMNGLVEIGESKDTP